MKDSQETSRRKLENKEKMVLQETLKSLPRAKLLALDSRRVFLPWQQSYQSLKASLKSTGMVDWKAQLLKLAKDSLKINQDSEACLYLTELRQFESYIQAEYILGINLVNDLFSKLFNLPKAKDVPESIKMCTEALNILRTTKERTYHP
jgi:hypothetical protein